MESKGQTMTHLSPERLDDYAEGRLSPAERSAAEAHLAACSVCQQSVASLMQMADLLSAAPRVTPPLGLAASIIAQLEPTLPMVEPDEPSLLSAPNWARVAWYGLGMALAWLGL